MKLCSFNKSLPTLAELVPPTPEFYWQHSFWLSINKIRNIILSSSKLTKKVLQCFVWSNTLSNLRSKLVTDDVIKNFVASSLWFKQFLVWNQKANSHLQFELSTCQLFKNCGNDVTNNDVINLKVNFFKPKLKIQILFKTWHFHNFWIGCWIVKTFWH